MNCLQYIMNIPNMYFIHHQNVNRTKTYLNTLQYISVRPPPPPANPPARPPAPPPAGMSQSIKNKKISYFQNHIND